jgi:hypothetical protein
MFKATANLNRIRGLPAASGERGGVMRIAIIGAGNVGSAIVYGVRDPTKKPEERSAKTVVESLSGVEAVILATP